MTCAFIGLRQLPFRIADSDPAYKDICLRLQKEITLLCEQGVTDFYCGMDMGADQLCAEILLGLKRAFPEVRLHAAVPFRGRPSDGRRSSGPGIPTCCAAAIRSRS